MTLFLYFKVLQSGKCLLENYVIYVYLHNFLTNHTVLVKYLNKYTFNASIVLCNCGNVERPCRIVCVWQLISQSACVYCMWGSSNFWPTPTTGAVENVDSSLHHYERIIGGGSTADKCRVKSNRVVKFYRVFLHNTWECFKFNMYVLIRHCQKRKGFRWQKKLKSKFRIMQLLTLNLPTEFKISNECH